MELAADRKPETGAEPAATAAPRAGPPPAPAELAPLFPELELESLLGAGGMGAVYRARQKRLGRTVALKVLHRELSDDPVFVERFLREAQALAKLAHPGIVAVHDYGERAGRCFLVMEHVDGANLRTLLRAGTLAPRQTLEIVRQLCDALQFAHDEGVVHRDIKPENVLVDAKGRVRVADFGLAKLIGGPASVSLTDAGQVMGTPHYMAPEQMEHPRDVDHRADLYSLGVVFYEMLTGALPLGRFLPPSERVQVDVRLDEIVLKSLEHERERRYQHAVQVKTAVERVEREPTARQRRLEPSGLEDAGLFIAATVGRPGTDAWSRRFSLSGVYLPSLHALLGQRSPPDGVWSAILVVAWIASAASFNLGAGWFAVLSLPLLAWLFVSLVASRSGAEPVSGTRWLVRHDVGAFLTAALGLVALFLAHAGAWERWTWDYVAGDQRPMAGLERLRGAEPALLTRVGVALDAPSAPALTDLRLEAQSSHWLSSSRALFEHPIWLAALACFLLGAAAVIVARGNARPASEWRRSAASSLALFFLPLVGLHASSIAVHGGRQQLEAVFERGECRGAAGELGQDLYRALVARELQVHAEHSARIVDRRNQTVLAEVHVLAARPASVFARWRMTWRGPQRLEPHVQFTVVSAADGERASIQADGGLARSDDPPVETWREELRTLLNSVCSTPGRK